MRSGHRLGRRFGWLWGAYGTSALGTWLAFGAFPLNGVVVLHAGRCRKEAVDFDAVRTLVAWTPGRSREAALALRHPAGRLQARGHAGERDLGVRLFTRTARGAQLTVDGQVSPAPRP